MMRRTGSARAVKNIDPSKLEGEQLEFYEAAKKDLKAKDELSLSQLGQYAKKLGGDGGEMFKSIKNALSTSRPGKPKTVHKLQVTGGVDTAEYRQNLERSLEKYVIGQTRMKKAMIDSLIAKQADYTGAPTSIIVPGPSGVGKSQFAKALAHALHGDTSKHVRINLNEINDTAGFNTVLGSPPGYVGSQAVGESTLPLGNKRLQEMFQGQKPYIILFDEVDKLGSGNNREQLQKDFWELLGGTLEDGKLTLRSGEEVDMSDAIFLFTSNEGMDDADNIPPGDALNRHYTDATLKVLPGHVPGRVDAIICAEPLTHDDLINISAMKMREFSKPIIERADQEKDISVTISVAPRLNKLMAELGYDEKRGAREMEKIIKKLVTPQFGKVLQGGKDGERYLVQFSEAATDKWFTDVKRAFSNALDGIPESVSVENFPLEIIIQNPDQALQGYDGSVPGVDPADTFVLGSGLLNGRGYVILNQGQDGSVNEMFTLRAGASAKADKFVPVKLPDALANVNFTIQSANLSPTKIILSGLSVDGDDISQPTYIYDAKSNDFLEIDAPPVPLMGAALGAAGGKAVLLGGRVPTQDAEGNWMVAPEDLNGEPIESEAYIYDEVSQKWDSIAGPGAQGRAGMGVAVVDDKIWFVGGEETAQTPNGYAISKSVSTVNVFDPLTNKFERGQDLPSPVTDATVFNDQWGRVVVMGGVELVENGAVHSPKDTVLMLDPTVKRPRWKEPPNIDGEARNAAVIPHKDGQIIGPVFDEFGTAEFKHYKA